MKNSNNYGGIQKLNGKRRKPYMAYKNVKTGIGIVKQLPDIERIKLQMEPEKAFSMYMEAINALHVPDITVINMLYADAKSRVSAADIKYRKVAIGYYETKKEAQIALADYNANNIDIYGSKITFGEILRNIIADELQNANVKKAYERIAVLHDMPIANVKTEDLQLALKSVEGFSAFPIRMVTSMIHNVFEYALKNDLVRRDYSQYMVPPTPAESKGKTAFTREEVALIWSEYSKSKNWVLRTTLILLYSGMRIGELLALKNEDIKDDCFYVHGTKTKNADRIVPVHEKIKPLLNDTIYVVEVGYKKVPYITFYENYVVSMKGLGLSHTIHETRHTFATYSKASNMNESYRKFIMGHAGNNITDDVYTHKEMLIDNLKGEMKKYYIC